MSKSTKIILLIAGICCVAGLAICLIAFLLGGTRGTAIGISKDGITAGGSDKMVADRVELEEFDELTFDFADYEFIMEPGDGYSLEYNVLEDKVPKISQKGKKLTITEPSTNYFYVGFEINNTKNQVILTVPADSKVYNVDGDISSGTANISAIDLKGKFTMSSGDIILKESKANEDIDIELSSGDLRIEDCDFRNATISITSGKVNVYSGDYENLVCKATSGAYDLNDVNAKRIECTLSSGEFDAKRIGADSVAVQCTSGDVDMTLLGAPEDYKMDLKKTSGRIEIDEKDYESGNYNDSADKDLSVDIVSGDVDIEFE